MIQFNVTNHSLAVGEIYIIGVSSSSMLQVGDTDYTTLYSMFDTPPESVIVGSMAPLPEPDGSEAAVGESTVIERHE